MESLFWNRVPVLGAGGLCLPMTAPKFTFGEVVYTYCQNESGEGCLDRGIILGLSVPDSHQFTWPGWMYLVGYPTYPRQPLLKLPYFDWWPEFEIWKLSATVDAIPVAVDGRGNGCPLLTGLLNCCHLGGD